VAAALNDESGMQRELQWAASKPLGAVGTLGYAAVGRMAYLGKFKKAHELSAQALRVAKENNFKDVAAGIAAFEGLIEALGGNFAEARERLTASRTLSHTRTNLPMAAPTFALAEDRTQSEAIIDELRRRYPLDTIVNNVSVPCAQALLESGRGDPAKGIQTMQVARRFELAPAYGFMPVYQRGLLYLRAKQGQEAAGEFQKILGYHALGAIMPAYPLSYVGLARAYTLTGEVAKSRKAYQDFFALWKDADPDIPILKQAKAEYAKLQ
jgi:eukaryotic-like serine/threonine-protein kinase